MTPDILKSLAAFLAAGITCIFATVASALPGDSQAWLEGGAWVAFTGCLIYAIRHLNEEVRRQQDLRERDREKMENLWRGEHEANRENREKLADSLNRLSEAVARLLEDRR